jgi:predicted nucleic acid-binding protein
MTEILLDTDVVINLLKKKEETIATFHSLRGATFYLSPIVIA